MDIIGELYPKRKENPKTISGNLLWFTEKSAHNCKHFILRNKTFIDVLFISIYLIEQSIFLYFVLESIYSVRTLSTIFILTLLTTMAIERSLMELRYTSLNKEVSILTNQAKEFRNKISKIKEIIESNTKRLK